MTTLRDMLNRARWGTENLHELSLVVVHRGAPGDRRTIGGARIMAVLPAGIELSPDADESESVFVPYHRFLSIRTGDGALLWSKESEPADSAEGASAALLPASLPAAPSAAVARVVERGVEVLPTFSVVLHERDSARGLVIDGSAGEGGGQILRTALSLSLITGIPFTLERVRAGRKKPGLMRQHLTAVKAAAVIGNAEVEGAALGSPHLVFRPRGVTGGEYDFDIGSAGSTALVIQTLALPLTLCGRESRVHIRGGTHALWTPIQPFLESAWLPLVRRCGAQVDVVLHKPGFYPAGGGEVTLTCAPTPTLLPLYLPERRGDLSIEVEAIVSNIPEGIARRELTSVAEALPGTPVTLKSATVRSPGPGNAVWLTARPAEESAASNVFSAIGERGVSAEQVGSSVAEAFMRWRDTHTSVEEHLADQIMLPIALAGEGSYTCSALSLHTRTNLEVIHAFTGRRFTAWDLGDSRYRMELESQLSESRVGVSQHSRAV